MQPGFPVDHHQAVRASLNLLKPRLEAYLHARLKACMGAGYVGREPRIARKPDTQALLSILLDQWNRCFANLLKPSERSIAYELKAARNLWAHEADISWDQSYRCVDNVQLLLRAIDARDADKKLDELKRSLRAGGEPPRPPAPPELHDMPPQPADRVFSSFEAFVREAVLPHKQLQPKASRVDGQETGGNREVFGSFWHDGRLWRVNSDTHYEPLLLAYEHREAGPFVKVQTASGLALELLPRLQALRSSRHKHLYIYAESSAHAGAAGHAVRGSVGRTAGGAAGTAAEGRRIVIEELKRRGAQASERREGMKHLLEVNRPGDGARVFLRVKAKRSGTWQGRVGDGDATPPVPVTPTFWVFVDLGSTPPQFHIVPEEWIRKDIHDNHQIYLQRHGGKRAVAQESDHHAIQPGRVQPWRDRWDLIGCRTGQRQPPG